MQGLFQEEGEKSLAGRAVASPNLSEAKEFQPMTDQPEKRWPVAKLSSI